MKITGLICVLSSVACIAANAPWQLQSMPRRCQLEWHAQSADRELLCELPVDLAKLARLTGTDAGSPDRVAVVATQGDQHRVLPVMAQAPRKADNATTLRFAVPANSDCLWLYFGGPAPQAAMAIPAEHNLVPPLDSTTPWHLNYSAETFIPLAEGPDTLLAHNDTKATFTREFALPADAAGQDAVLELDMRSEARLNNFVRIYLRQLDEQGELLPSSVVDPRWISMIMPPDKPVSITECGRFDSRARALRVIIEVRYNHSGFDPYGRPLADASVGHPRLRLSHFALRVARNLPFPTLNDALFTDGLSGRPGDAAFRLGHRQAFFFITAPQAQWGEGRTLTEQRDIHWPIAGGTAECWLKPDWTSNKTVVLLQGYTASAYEVKPSRKGPVWSATYNPEKKTLAFVIKDPADWESHKHEAQVDFPHDAWSHLAFCWGPDHGVKVFLNGKTVINSPETPFTVPTLHPDGKYRYVRKELGDASLKTNDKDRSIAERADRVIPNYFCIGMSGGIARSAIHKSDTAILTGACDSLRLSSTIRYQGDFTPDHQLAPDEHACAFFAFNRSFDGTRGSGDRFISGTPWTEQAPVTPTLKVQSPDTEYQIRWTPETVADNANPKVVFDKCNYPDPPTPDDFNAARITKTHQFSIAPGESTLVTLDAPAYMDFIDIACPLDAKPLVAPILLGADDIDTRSYGDLADSLRLDTLPDDHARCVKLFQMLLNAADYFMSHQAEISADGSARSVEYRSLSMLNSYCAFECGPLNSLACILFATVARCPSAMTAGYGHSFEQVFYNNQMNLYDLSAQQFFSNRNMLTPASLAEMERDPYPLTNGNGHFARHGIRGCVDSSWINVMPERKAYTLNPGENFRIFWHNNGLYNNVQANFSRSKSDNPNWINISDLAGVEPKTPVWRVDNRPLPHVALATHSFNGRPQADNPAFTDCNDDGFSYPVKSAYAILRGEFAVVCDRDLSLALSRDRGTTWLTIAPIAPNQWRLDYEVRARDEYIVRFNAPITAVKHLAAKTTSQVNPRFLPGALQKGANNLRLKADAGTRAQITMQYRQDAAPVVFAGGGSFGAIRGMEKQVFIVTPEQPAQIAVTGAGPNARVSASDGLRATWHDNVITVACTDATPRIGQITLHDGQRGDKNAMIITCPGARMSRADNAQLAGGATCQQPANAPMPVVNLNGPDGRCIFPFAEIPAGKYALFNLHRPPRQYQGDSRQHLLIIDGGKDIKNARTARIINPGPDFYKAEFGRDLSRFKWDFPITGSYPFHDIDLLDLPQTNAITLKLNGKNDTDLAAFLLVPADNIDFIRELVIALTRLNYIPVASK
ncbi:MAG: hypothetical protein PHT80_06640 [Lentisphaeria bacterium]|nr:hypothetical protein [Lentisphaeria bacterium]